MSEMTKLLKMRGQNKKLKNSLSRKIFSVVNYVLLLTMAFLCILPLIHVLAISLSNASKVAAGAVTLVPVDFNVSSYRFLIEEPQFLKSFLVSVQRIILALMIHGMYILLTAYALSKERKNFSWRPFYVVFFFITMIFQGGLIPTFFVVRATGLYNTLMALVLPLTIWQVFNVILMLNFFRQLPKELEEAAFMDGANHWRVLFQIYIPTSAPSIATITLFLMVFQWNEWFSALIYLESSKDYPLQTYLRELIATTSVVNMEATGPEDIDMNQLSRLTSQAAQIFVGMVPILIVYPFLQKYFAKGIVLGSVKG